MDIRVRWLVASSRETSRAYVGHFLRHWSHQKGAFDVVLERWLDNFMRPGNMQGGVNWYVGQNAGRLAVMAGTAQRPPRITVPTRVLGCMIRSSYPIGPMSWTSISLRSRFPSLRMLVTSCTTNARIWPREKSTDSSRVWREVSHEEKQTHIGPR